MLRVGRKCLRGEALDPDADEVLPRGLRRNFWRDATGAESALERAGEALTRVREIAARVRKAVEAALEEAARTPQRT